MNFKAFYCIFNKKIILTIQYIFIEKTFVVILTENVIINYK